MPIQKRNRLTAFHEVRHIDQPLYPWFEEEDKLEDGVLYVVDGVQKDGTQQIEYNCPCGCGNTVMIPFYREGQMKHETPAWAFREDAGKVTLSPSVFSTGWPCRSHYFIRGNQIHWCG
jgi:hypothetical protein